MDINTKAHIFFSDGKPRGTINDAVLTWQADLGYISPSITMNWMAIAQDNGIRYLGDLDMQNGVSTGRYVIDDDVEEG